jgi:hypothetical protein
MIAPSAANLPRRYPGLKPFERAQRAVFHGRRDDIQRLTNLVVRERLTVMFAKSGIGKTSLLQAGVAPELEQQGFVPIFLRGDKTDEPLTATFAELLERDPQVGSRDATGQVTGPEAPAPTLWELLKRLEFDHDGLPATPVLIFDQFEEVFTLGHSESSRRSFLAELADLTNETMPEAIRGGLLQRFQENHPEMTVELMQWWERQPDLRIVISIRSDFLHHLDDISPLIPGILRNRYQLRPLNRAQAREAIEAPAAATGGPFASQPFRFQEDALQEILDFLAGRTSSSNGVSNDGLTLKRAEEIESFNLQILCQFVEEKIIAERIPAQFVVERAFYGGHEGLEHEISNFYQKQLLNLPDLFARKTGQAPAEPEALMFTAQCLIEESLVTPIGRRCSMVDDFLTSTWKVSHDFLDTLVDSRLLRKELRLDDYYYEISHDTLLPAIIESRDGRRLKEKAEQEKSAFESQLAEEAEKRAAVEKELRAVGEKRKLARMVAITSVISLVVTLVFAIWFAYNWVGSVRQELEQVEDNVFDEQFDAAIDGYNELNRRGYKCWILRHTPPYKNVSEEMLDAQRFQSLYNAIVREHIRQGDSLFFADDYAQALNSYNTAFDSLQQYAAINYQQPTHETLGHVHKASGRWRVDPARIEDKVNTLEQRRASAFNTLRVQFDIHQRKFESFQEARAWPQALRNLRIMQSLLPRDAEYLQRLKADLGLSQDPRQYVEGEIRAINRR